MTFGLFRTIAHGMILRLELEWKSWNSTWLYNVRMCMTRRWRKDMPHVFSWRTCHAHMSVLSCQVEIVHVQCARQGVGEKIWGLSVLWGVSVLWRPTWPRLVPRLLDWLSCQWPVLSLTYTCARQLTMLKWHFSQSSLFAFQITLFVIQGSCQKRFSGFFPLKGEGYR